MFRSKCGVELKEQQKFCPNCGKGKLTSGKYYSIKLTALAKFLVNGKNNSSKKSSKKIEISFKSIIRDCTLA